MFVGHLRTCQFGSVCYLGSLVAIIKSDLTGRANWQVSRRAASKITRLRARSSSACQVCVATLRSFFPSSSFFFFEKFIPPVGMIPKYPCHFGTPKQNKKTTTTKKQQTTTNENMPIAVYHTFQI